MADHIATTAASEVSFWSNLSDPQAAVLAAVFGAVVAGIISPLVVELIRSWKKERKWAAPRKKLLRQLLKKKDFRTLETLSRVSGTKPEDCRTLLIELGARGALLSGEREGWTLSPIGTEKPDEFSNSKDTSEPR